MFTQKSPFHPLAVSALTLSALALTLTACSPQAQHDEQISAQAQQSAPAESLKAGIFYLEGSLDPKNMFDAWVLVRVGAGETLLRLSDNGALEPWLCQDYEVIDPLNYRITLRPNLTFSDGTALTALDVKNNLERVMALNPRAPQYFKLDHITVESATELTITTKEPVPELFYNLCEPLFALIKLPEDALPTTSDAVWPDVTIVHPITTGPYQVTAFTPNQSVTVRANPHYRKGSADLILELEFLYLPEEQSRSLALQSGQVDLIATVNFATLPLFVDNQDYVVRRRISPRTNVVYINHDNQLLAQDKIRHALDLAINREQIVSLIGGQPAASLIAPNFVQGFAPSNPYRIAQAKQILDDAGIVDHNGDGTRDIQGQELSFDYYFKADHGSADSALIAQCLQQDFAALGVKLNLFPAENLPAIMASGDFDFFSANDSTLPTGDPYVFMHSRFHSAGDANFGHYHSPKLEQLLSTMAQTFDPEKRHQLTQALLTELKSDVAAFFINHIEINEVASSKLNHLHLYSFDYYFIDDQVRVHD